MVINHTILMKSKFGDVTSIQRGEKEPIGYYRHNGPQPISKTRRDFETASYSETTEVPPGIYPIYPGWKSDGRHGGEATLYVEFEGKVVHDYFPSSFGGVIYEQPKPKHTGEPRKITQRLDIAKAIKDTGTIPHSSPGKDGSIPPDIYIDPKVWGDIKKYYENILDLDLKYFKKVLSDIESGKKTLSESTGTLRYCASCMHDTATTLETVELSNQYLKTPTFGQLHTKNTSWVPKVNEKAKEKLGNEQEIS